MLLFEDGVYAWPSVRDKPPTNLKDQSDQLKDQLAQTEQNSHQRIFLPFLFVAQSKVRLSSAGHRSQCQAKGFRLFGFE